MGIDQNPSLAHLVFLNLQDLTEGIHLTAHVFHHLVDSVNLDFAFLKRSRAKRMAMCSAAFISRGVSSACSVGLGGKAPQQLLQIDFGVRVNGAEFLLQCLVLALGSPPTSPNLVSRRMVWMTSSSWKRNNPACPGPPSRRIALRRRFRGRWERYRRERSPPASPGAPLFAPSAAAISCSNFCGSLSHCLNSGPSV